MTETQDRTHSDYVTQAILDAFDAAEVVSTGGGCTAIHIPLVDERFSLLITDGNSGTYFAEEGSGFYMVRQDNDDPCLDTDEQVVCDDDRVTATRAVELVRAAVMESETMATPIQHFSGTAAADEARAKQPRTLTLTVAQWQDIVTALQVAQYGGGPLEQRWDALADEIPSLLAEVSA